MLEWHAGAKEEEDWPLCWGGPTEGMKISIYEPCWLNT